MEFSFLLSYFHKQNEIKGCSSTRVKSSCDCVVGIICGGSCDYESKSFLDTRHEESESNILDSCRFFCGGPLICNICKKGTEKHAHNINGKICEFETKKFCFHCFNENGNAFYHKNNVTTYDNIIKSKSVPINIPY
jgi:hypothetical protein